MQTLKKNLHVVSLLLLLLITPVVIPLFLGSGIDEPVEESLAGTEESPVTDPIDIKSVALDDLAESLQAFGPINSIVIYQHGEPVTEKYFRGMSADRTHNIKSASKSILSILAGIAIDRGYLEGVDQAIEPFFQDYFSQYPDSVKASITVSDLLTMRAGLQSTSGKNYGSWVVSRDWIHNALGRPLVGTPGEDRIYSTGTTHLLGVVLARASSMSLRQFANRYLFGPMDIRLGGWDRDPDGYYLGGNNMALRPADMVKIGQLMLDTGVYNGKRIVSKEWVQRSVEPVTGRHNREHYGYLWFRRMAGGYHMVYAFGNGGQYIMILPELDAVIAITTRTGASNTRRYRSRLFVALDREIIPWLEAAYRGSR